MPAFVESRRHSQSRARLMFVTTLGMDNFDCTKMNAHFTTCLWEGLIHTWKQALLAPPLPLMSVNNSRLCSTHNHYSAFLCTGAGVAPTINCVFQLKPSPALEAPGHGHVLGLAYGAKPGPTQLIQSWATATFLLPLHKNLLSQAGSSTTPTHSYMTLHHSTKLRPSL